MTSVELLVDKVEQISNNKNLSKQEAIDLYNKSIVQAKKIHKQEIENAYAQAMIKENGSDYIGMNEEIDAEIYYNKTFKKD